MRRLLVGAVVLMGVMILFGMLALGVVVNHRLAIIKPGQYRLTVLDEPAGTHIAGVAAFGGEMALTLAGGGADRVVLVNPVTGRISARVALKR